MLNPEQKKLLHSLKDTSYGLALKAFLDSHYEKIGDITTCKSFEETMGRQYALKLLKELFAFMDKKDSTTKEKNQYE